MKDYGQIISTITGSPWLITSDSLRMILEIVDRRLDGERLDEGEIRARIQQNAHNHPPIKSGPKTGVLRLHGPIFPKANLMTELSGATDLQTFRSNFRALMEDDNVTSIVLDVDSPGGSSLGVEETAAEIRAARETKPVYAVANGLAASAAYFIASQATELYQTPSGYTGSVGAYMVHTDESELEQKIGVNRTVIKAGRFKATEITPLNPESREYLQGIVTDCYDSFVEGVALGRKTTVEDVTANYGEGGIVSAKNALEAGMVDGIAEFDAVLGSVVGTGTTVSMMIPRYAPSTSEREMEHSEPGSGSGGEPVPRTPPEDEDIDTWEKGERFDDPRRGNPEETVDREQLVALATALGIKHEGVEDGALYELVQTELETVVSANAEIREAAASATQALDFAKQYPEQAAELERLRKERLSGASKTFASQFERLEDTEGKPSNKGLSILARETVEEAHLKLSQNVLIADDLRDLVLTVATGVVEYGEKGSSRVKEATGIDLTDRKAVRDRAAELVKTRMEEDGLDHKRAARLVFQENPDLAQAYFAPTR